MKKPKKVIICGAGGRDFHNFLVYFKDDPEYEVVGFTATQIPGIEQREFPKELAGDLYNENIKIYPEKELPNLIKQYNVDEVVLSYSDLPYKKVMNKASIVRASGAGFRLMNPRETMIKSKKPVISVCAVRTGAGKSPTTRKICRILQKLNKKFVTIRHPMPYGKLEKQICQRFSSYEDLDKHETTIEEREEYEPYIDMGLIVYAGVDYKKILEEAEKEGDIIIWDGGNNDLPFYKPDLHIVLADAKRPGHEISYYPGEANARMADIIIINKVKSANPEDVKTIEKNIRMINSKAKIIYGDLKLNVKESDIKNIQGKDVLVVEDGPTLTHGGLSSGAGHLAAKKFGANKIIDARKYAIGSIKKIYEEYTHLKEVLPAMGYGKEQIRELQETINNAKCDCVVSGTPIDLNKIIKVNKPIVRVGYELEEVSGPSMEEIIKDFILRKQI